MEHVTIEINRLRVYAHHGVMPQERTIGNDFEVSVKLLYPASDAIANDNLDGTLNYAEVCAEIKSVMAEPSALLENVCGRLRNALSLRFPLITQGTIKVAKLMPPIPGIQMESVAVELTWSTQS